MLIDGDDIKPVKHLIPFSVEALWCVAVPNYRFWNILSADAIVAALDGIRLEL